MHSNDPLSAYTLIKDLRSGGEGKAILYEKDSTKYVCKQRIFDNLNDANQGLKEAMSLARIDHPNTVKFEDAIMSQVGDQIYLSIIMEYCPLGDLLDFLIDLSEPMNHHTVTLGSELSSMNLGSEYSSDIDSTTSRTSSSSSMDSAATLNSQPDSIIHSTSSPSLIVNTTPNKESGGSNRHSLSSPSSTSNTPITNTPRKSSKSSASNKQKCSLKERKCIIKMTKDLTKMIFTGKPSKEASTSSPSRSSSNLCDQVIHSNELKKDLDSVYLIEQAQLIEWLLDLSQGVQALHKANLIHRDLKSENIFISASNKLKVGDFGLAVSSNHRNGSIHNETVGTYCYSSPELLNSTYDKTTDIFSLGCIFYELITLKLLAHNRIYIGEDMLNNKFDPMQFLSTFPQKYEKLGPLVLSMLSQNPTFRPSIESIIEQLQTMDTSLLREKIIVKRENTIKGIKKQLDKTHFQEAALILAKSFVHDPRFSTIFPPSDPTSVPQLQHLFKYILKVLSGHRCNIWGYFALDGSMLSTFVWIDPSNKKEVRLSDCIKGSISMVSKIGLKKVGQVLDLMRFDDSVLAMDVNNPNNSTAPPKSYHGKNQQPHWMLAYCATSEIYRGSGIGSYMCENVLNWSDHTDMPVKTLLFSKNSLEFFQNQGFEINTEIKTGLPKGVSNVLVLVRKPKHI